MKGVVNKRLNKRVQSASVNAEKLKPYEVGDVVEIVEILNGDDIDGNNVWYRLDDGTYVWSGGIAGNREMPEMNKGIDTTTLNYNKIFENIPAKIRDNKGKGVKVAVLDSGMNFNSSFFTKSKIIFEDSQKAKDLTGHGSHVAGVIGANSSGLTGVAPECEFYISKITANGGNYIKEHFIRGLKWAIEEVKVDILNLSFQISRIADDEAIKALLQSAVEKNICIVAAAGNDSFLGYSEGFYYPAMFEECIAVGSVTKSFLAQNQTFKYLPELDFITIQENIPSAGLGNVLENRKGSSMSAAFVSGLIALIKSNSPNLSIKEVRNTLNQIAYSLESETYPNNPYSLLTHKK